MINGCYIWLLHPLKENGGISKKNLYVAMSRGSGCIR